MSQIIHKADEFLQEVKIVFPKKVHKLLEFGFKSLSLQRIISLNSNARNTILNSHTAESKAYRLVKNLRFIKIFPFLLVKLNLIKENDIVAVDFSDFKGINVLMFGKQTKGGRAVPLFFDIIIYPIEKGSQNIFIVKTIAEFLKTIEPIKVKLVFDRGFAIPHLIKYLAQIKATFYIRIKGIKHVEYLGKIKKVKKFKSGKYTVKAYNYELSLTVTPKPRNVKKKYNEPWYIISNDLTSSPEQVQKIYYYRFEIEELFRDVKRIFGLEYVKFKIPDNFKTALWFVVMGIWFHYYLEGNLEESKSAVKKCKNSFNQGITHYWLEKLQLYFRLPALEQISIKSG
jgi:hypothetical protein